MARPSRVITAVPIVTQRRDGSDSKTTGYRLDDRGSIPGRSKKYFSSAQCPDRFKGPPSLLYNGYHGSFLVIESPGQKAYHSHPFSSEVKNNGAKPPPPTRLHGVVFNDFTYLFIQ
jgi:hypothetical protein